MTDDAAIPLLVDDRTITCASGATLLNVLKAHAIAVQTACGGRGNCHLCRVTITAGKESLPPPNGVEKRALGNVLIAQGMRLSCQLTVRAPLALKLEKPRDAKG